MARIKMEDIVDQLSSELKRALRDAVRRTLPDADFSEQELFRNFKREVGRKCNTWERVSDRFVENE